MASLREVNLSKHFHFSKEAGLHFCSWRPTVAPVAEKQTLQETTADDCWGNFQFFYVTEGWTVGKLATGAVC